MSRWEWWGRALVLPYLLVFVVFVLYPVGYGLWLARHPQSYVQLFDDPIFFRTAVNTVIFLVVAINIKMVIALVLSGFFVQSRWWIKALSVLFILPWAVPSIPDHPVGALHAEPGVGGDQLDHLSAHRSATGRTG